MVAFSSALENQFGHGSGLQVLGQIINMFNPWNQKILEMSWNEMEPMEYYWIEEDV